MDIVALLGETSPGKESSVRTCDHDAVLAENALPMDPSSGRSCRALVHHGRTAATHCVETPDNPES